MGATHPGAACGAPTGTVGTTFGDTPTGGAAAPGIGQAPVVGHPAAVATGTAAGVPTGNAPPHNPQKRMRAELPAPHEGQKMTIRVPQAPQKRWCAGFSKPHVSQRNPIYSSHRPPPS